LVKEVGSFVLPQWELVAADLEAIGGLMMREAHQGPGAGESDRMLLRILGLTSSGCSLRKLRAHYSKRVAGQRCAVREKTGKKVGVEEPKDLSYHGLENQDSCYGEEAQPLSREYQPNPTQDAFRGGGAALTGDSTLRQS
jgi:hypothetical protein